MLPSSGSVTLKTAITLKAAVDSSLTVTAGCEVLSKSLIFALFETWVLLAIAQFVVKLVFEPGFTLSISVQLPPLSREYITCTKLAAACFQVISWVVPTGAFWAPLKLVRLRLETILNVLLVLVTFALSTSYPFTKPSSVISVGTCGQIKLVPLVTASFVLILVQFNPPLLE